MSIGFGFNTIVNGVKLMSLLYLIVLQMNWSESSGFLVQVAGPKGPHVATYFVSIPTPVGL